MTSASCYIASYGVALF